MTAYFEVLDHDGAARLGTLRLDAPVETPTLADGIVVDAGSAWVDNRSPPPPAEDVVTILPHRGLPPGTPDRIAETFSPPTHTFEGPAGVVVSPTTAADYGADLYTLSSASGIVGHASAFRDAIVSVRETIPPDTALYLSGVATPANVAMLVYAGVDLVDAVRARLAGTRGIYLTTDGARPIDGLTALPCACPSCTAGIASFDRSSCVEHNVSALETALTRIRDRIRDGKLREYVSAQCRHDPWLTAALREFDEEYSYLEHRVPLYRQADLAATTEDDLRRIEVTRYADRIVTRYRNRFSTPLVLLPCSATKPYSRSQSHRQFRDAIDHRAHRVALSSPVGVVPQELECTYPAQHYDIPVTGHWTATEREWVSTLLTRYLERNRYPRIIAHVPAGAYRQIVDAALDGHDVPVTYTVVDHPTTDASLDALADALAGTDAYSRTARHENTVKAIADYQFGPGAGDELFADITVEAPYPKHRVRNATGTLLATMVPAYGLLALTIAGAKQWAAVDVPIRRVEIDNFVPHGDVLAPGIRDADDAIRIGDEVIVSGPSAFGIGRATMHGRELVASTRGVAVDVRHCEERTC